MTQHAAAIGSGPSGLAAAIRLAEAGIYVTVYEAAARPGGGRRSYVNKQFNVTHDIFSAGHQLAICSSF